ncbi:capsular polysaccharide biosynthesis protein [Candidatus Pantoea formicae]|uniref:capsular polysaccharide biosynthesis protein n=1 Tax=Candidatus Pantoea formicae TaxID=2608355 RepID=UPI001965F1E6|nr:capsular polysaccharide biosynthesis protein [Pantoea formicae]
MYKKARKLLKNPTMFFADAIENKKLKNALKNEEITYAFHINEWKRPIIESWFPEKKIVYVPFNLKTKQQIESWVKRITNSKNSELLIWGMNLPERFSALNIKKTFVEDGFIRSIGLGASHTPPLSLNFDSRTLYFNSKEPSDLEHLLNTYEFDDELVNRARNMREKLLELGISKYNNSQNIDIDKIYGPKNKKRILIIGQVEDDASIKYGSLRRYTNNDIVTIAHLENPEAQIIYKPHPDVINGFRKFNSNPENVKDICQVIMEDFPLNQALQTVDHVYTISSLAGFEALMRGIHVTTLGCPFYSGWGLTDDRQTNERRVRKLTLDEVFAAAYIIYPKYFDPIYKKYITPEESLDILIGQKQSLKQKETLPIISDNEITIYGFHINDWKRPILKSWFPDRKFVFIPFKLKDKASRDIWIKKINNTKNAEIMIWGMKVHPDFLKINVKKTYIEDGFIRSLGLGASHTAPLSLNFDSRTLYFNAREESDLENILQNNIFDDGLIERAKAFKKELIESGISKYNNSEKIDISKIYGVKDRKRILVIGQVEDDASIEYGSKIKYTNNDIVMIARIENPEAQILYKPHPDVLSGFRKYQSNPSDVKNICSIITNDFPLSQALETIDHVYTISSLAGFEALIRGIHVTTLGCPFYSGWGLTDDRQENSRRTRKLTIDELFAGSYIVYPKYFDPIYRKYISPEEALKFLSEMKKIKSLNSDGDVIVANEKTNENSITDSLSDKTNELLSLREHIHSLEKSISMLSRKIDNQLIEVMKIKNASN